MDTISLRELNRATLARQHLVERVAAGAAAEIEHLAGMQAQYSPSPYIGLWSRLVGFQRAELADALAAGTVLKATLMRGTLHLLATRRLAAYRIGAGSSYFDTTLRQLAELGADLAAIRALVVDEVGRGPRTRAEVSRLIGDHVAAASGGDVPAWVREKLHGVAALCVTSDLVNLAEDAAFGYFGGSRYRIAPATEAVTVDAALRLVATDYLGAFGPASRADLAAWSGKGASVWTPVLEQLDLVSFRSEDGRTLVDLPDAPRPGADTVVPIRFLPKWDNLLLAHARRERVLPDDYRAAVISKNGDVAPTILVDGVVAGTWDAPLRGPAVLRLRALGALTVRHRRAVETEGRRLLAWLRPDVPAGTARGAGREVEWA